MKKIIVILVAFVCMMPCASWSAVNVKTAGVKKAAPVATKQSDKMESAASLLPTVVGLVANVKSLNTQQQQLSADCNPTSSEIEIVNNLMKEYAKTGTVKGDSVARGLGDKKCPGSYQNYVEVYGNEEKCYEVFKEEQIGENNKIQMIWTGFPKASSAVISDDFDKKNQKVEHNVYDVFARIPFTEEDYTQAEAKKLAQFKEKANRCARGKINAAKRELFGDFVTQTLSNVGQSSGAAGTASVLEAVSSMGGSGDMKSMLPSLGSMATQMLDK